MAVDSIFSHFTNRWNHRTKPAEECAVEMIRGKAIIYDPVHRDDYADAAPKGAAYDQLIREAHQKAQIGAAKGQVRERWYGRY